MQTFIIVVLDQVGYGDGVLFPNLKARFRDPARVSTSYLPTVTETAHATMSTGDAPSGHGVIGAEALVGPPTQISRSEITETVFRAGPASGLPFSAQFDDIGAEVYTLAGKPKVARLLDPRPSANPEGLGRRATRVSLIRLAGGDYALERLDNHGNRKLVAAGLSALGDPRIDQELLRVTADLLHNERDPSAPAAVFVALPLLDVVGHRSGRSSQAFRGAAATLDDALEQFFTKLDASDDEYEAVLIGDHGCRPCTAAVWPTSDGQSVRCLDASGVQGVLALPHQVLTVDGSNERAVVFDGGTVRVRTRPGDEKAAAAFLEQHWAQFIEHAVTNAELGAHLAREGAGSSSHLHWGDAVGFARPHVAVCKHQWMKCSSTGTPLPPVAEHGTAEAMDRDVPRWGTIRCAHEDLLERARDYLGG